MSRPTYEPKQTYIGTGSLSSYTFDFKIESNTQLEIIEINDLGVETQRVRGDDTVYLSSVVFDNIDGEGTVNLKVNLPINYKLLILQANDAPTQPYEFKNKGSFTLERIELALDFIAGAIQRLTYRAKQALRIHDADDFDTFDTRLPIAIAQQAERPLIIHLDGDKFDYGPTQAETIVVANNYADTQDAAQSVTLSTLMDTKDAAQTVVLEGTMDTKDAAQSVVLEASMVTKDNQVRADLTAVDNALQNAIDAIEVKTDNITVTQPVNLDEMEAQLAGGGAGSIAEWTTGIIYEVDSIIWENEDFYRCIIQHTSGATFAGDAANWSQMSDKLTATEVKASYESNADTNAYTDAEKSKVALLESSRFLGTYIDLPALELAHATADDGEYANVDAGLGNDVIRYLWDSSDSQWILGAGTVLTAAEIKSLYESNLDTNAYTDLEKTKLAGIEDAATADQTGAEIKALYEANGDTNAYTDAEKAELAALRSIHTESDEPSGFVRSTPNIMGIIELSPDGTLVHRIDQNGTYSQNSTGLFYDGAAAVARTVRVSPVTGQDLIVYINGTRHVMAAQSTAQFPAVSGLKYIYYNAAGVLTGSTTFDYTYFDGTPIVAIAYGNATTGDLVMLGDERHGITMDGFTHRYLHTTEGARYGGGMNIAGLAAGVTVHGDLGAGSIYDEDIFKELPIQTNLPFWHIEGADWNIISDTNLLGYIDGTDIYISYNRDTGGGVYELTEILGSNEATIMYIVATNSAQFPYIKIIGQNKYDKVSDAQNEIGTELAILNTDLLPTPEFVFVGAIILNRSGELQPLDDGSMFLDLRTIKIPAQGGLSDAIVDHRTVTFRGEPGAHPADAITFDPTIEGVMEVTVTDVQAAIDVASTLGGVGDTSTYQSLDADTTGISKWDVTGKLGALFTENTVGQLAGKKDYDYSTNINTGAVVSIDFDVPVRSRADQSSTHKIQFPFIQTGTEGTIQCEIYDVTNAASIKTIDLENATNRYLSSFTMPALCTELRFIIKSITDGVATLNIDQISFSDKFGEYGSETISETSSLSGALGYGSTDTKIIRFDAPDYDNDLYKITTTLANGTIIEFKRSCEADIVADYNFSGAGHGGLSFNSSSLTTNVQALPDADVISLSTAPSSDFATLTGTKKSYTTGDKVRLHTDGGVIGAYATKFHLSITATSQSQTKQFEDTYEQASFKGKAIYDLSASYSTTSVTYVLPALSLTSSTLSGVLVQKTANAPSFTIPNAKPGTYTVGVTTGIGNASSTADQFAKIIANGSDYSETVRQGTIDGNLQFVIEHETEGDLDIELYVKTGSTLYIVSSVNLEMSVSYEPPSEQASAARLLSIPLVVHSNDEFPTGEKWIDDRKIYGQSLSLGADSTNALIKAVGTVEPIGYTKTDATTWLISGTTTQGVVYTAGNLNSVGTVYSGTTIDFKYVK